MTILDLRAVTGLGQEKNTMSIRLPLITAVLAMTIIAGNLNTALGKEPSTRAALAARQGLHDEYCVAMADGRITPSERGEMLRYAKKILKPEEFVSFKQHIDQISPPKPVAEKHRIVSASKKKSNTPSQWAKLSQAWTDSLAKIKNIKIIQDKPSREGETLITDQKEDEEVQKTASTEQNEEGAPILTDPVAKNDTAW
jgi:hypothetical protein